MAAHTVIVIGVSVVSVGTRKICATLRGGARSSVVGRASRLPLLRRHHAVRAGRARLPQASTTTPILQRRIDYSL